MSDHIIGHRQGYPENTVAAAPLDMLIALVVQRLSLAQYVAAVKHTSSQPIDDPIREQKILQSVAGALSRTGFHEKIGRQFFRDQIEANKIVQRGLHERWCAHPGEFPAVHCKLVTEVRPNLDRLTMEMVRQFKFMDGLPQLRLGYVQDLVAARYFTELSLPQLPELHRSAAVFALRSFCAER